ncbi:MAG: 5'-nucleotidase [Bacteroidales bacterium]
MKKIASILAVLLISLSAFSQNSYKWQRVAMDSTFDNSKVYGVDEILAKYQPKMGDLMKVVAYSDSEMNKSYPECGLSNLATDAMLDFIQPFKTSDISGAITITNFGGIRSSLPANAIRIYDIYSVFPFNNYIVTIKVKGATIRKELNAYAAKNQFRALGGVKIVVKDGKMIKCDIEGKPLDDNKTYLIGTVDYLYLQGGDDRLSLGKGALSSASHNNAFLRDVIVDYCKKITKKGIKLSGKPDGRIMIK